MIRKSGYRFSERIMLKQNLEHDPEKAAPDLIRGGYRFSEKIMLNKKPQRDVDPTATHPSLD
jgi:hypothetical protein